MRRTRSSHVARFFDDRVREMGSEVIFVPNVRGPNAAEAPGRSSSEVPVGTGTEAQNLD